MKLAIVGSRNFPSLHLVRLYVSKVRNVEDIEIVSGGAKGVDAAAKESALTLKLKYTEFKADWGAFGISAGFRRNKDIVLYSDRIVCFWDGSSKGTKHDIDLALQYKKHLEVIFP